MIASPLRSARDVLWLPTLGKAIPRPWFLPSEEVYAAQQRIMAGSYFLVNISGNAGIGEALICDPKKGGCGGKHRYLTRRCVELPFSGLTGGIYAYYRAVKDNGLAKTLAPAELARYGAAAAILSSLPDLSTAHPDTARALTTGLGPGEAVIGAIALGVLEPIPPTLARRYRDRINARGTRPRFVLPGLEG